MPGDGMCVCGTDWFGARQGNQHKAEYQIPETSTVRHILVKTPPPGADGKVDPKADEAAKAKAQDYLKQAKSGASFAELAKKYSDDLGTEVVEVPGPHFRPGRPGWEALADRAIEWAQEHARRPAAA